MIPDALYPSRIGTTDSEALFLAMMGAGLDRDPIKVTRQVLQSLCELANENGHRERMRFTSALANGRDLFAFRFAESDTPNSLYFREDGGQLIVVSEPFDKENDWSEVPPNHALIAVASRRAEIVPFLPSYREEKKQEPPRLQTVIARVQ